MVKIPIFRVDMQTTNAPISRDFGLWVVFSQTSEIPLFTVVDHPGMNFHASQH